MGRVSEIKKELKHLESLLRECTKVAEKAQNSFNRKNKYGMELDDFKSFYEGLVWGNEAQSKSRMLTQMLCANMGVDSKSDFESYFKITQFIDEAERYWTNQTRIDQLNGKIKKLQEELAPYEAQEASAKAAAADIKEVLEAAMADFKVEWFDKMVKWYRKDYAYIKSVAPEAKDWARRYERLTHNRDGFYFFRRHPMLESRFENKNKDCMATISNPANRYDDVDEYIEKVKKDLEMDWRIDMNTLADKCNKFGLDLNNVKVTNPSVTQKGFQCFITDGKPRVIDVRMIWAAEHSDYVKPHTRYIVTERKTR